MPKSPEYLAKMRAAAKIDKNAPRHSRSVNYRRLLINYMEHVFEQEGTTFTALLEGHIAFSKHDVALLQRLAKPIEWRTRVEPRHKP